MSDVGRNLHPRSSEDPGEGGSDTPLFNHETPAHNLPFVKVRFAVSVGIGFPDPVLLASVVTGAEEGGFDSIWFSDLTVLPGTNPFLAVSFAAAASHRLKLGVNLVPFGYRPFLFARQVAELDQIAAGRLLVTLVPGLDRAGERAALGISGQHRGRLLDSLVPDLRSWWAGEFVRVPMAAMPSCDLQFCPPRIRWRSGWEEAGLRRFAEPDDWRMVGWDRMSALGRPGPSGLRSRRRRRRRAGRSTPSTSD